MFCPRELKGEGKVRTLLRSPRVPSHLKGVGTFLGGTSCSPVGFPTVWNLQSKTFQLPKPRQQLREEHTEARVQLPCQAQVMCISAKLLLVLLVAAAKRRICPLVGLIPLVFLQSLQHTLLWGGLSLWSAWYPALLPASISALSPLSEDVTLAIFFERPTIHESCGGGEAVAVG